MYNEIRIFESVLRAAMRSVPTDNKRVNFAACAAQFRILMLISSLGRYERLNVSGTVLSKRITKLVDGATYMLMTTLVYIH